MEPYMAKETEGTPLGNQILSQRIAAALLLSNPAPGVNAHEMVNTYNVKEERTKVVKAYYDKQGRTMPAAAIVLKVDAERDIRHSRALASNMLKAHRTYIRPEMVDAHHIVGRMNILAAKARGYLFAWGIGINDADNGVFLPRYGSTQIAKMPYAPNHQGLHTGTYYLNVTLRLDAIKGMSSTAGRTVLKTIKNELIAGTFPF
jgi:A nuclease family of the HNH/ENDO VII superfamily with conserved AHH